MNFAESLGMAAAGLGIVFVVLVGLMLLIWAYTKIFAALQNRKPAEAAPAAAPSNDSLYIVTSQDSIGSVSLLNVDEKSAAVIMAIVSDNTQIPLNELRFKSIKLIGDEKK